MRSKFLSVIVIVVLFSSLNSTTIELSSQQDSSKSLLNNSSYLDIMSNWDWSETLANDYGITADDMALDSFGNIYIVGTMQGDLNLSDQSLFIGDDARNGKNVFVAKYSSIGELIWITEAGGDGDDYGRGIVVRETQNQEIRLYITGEFQLSMVDENQQLVQLDISLGNGEIYEDSVGEKVPFIAKLSSNGNWDWAQIANGIDNNGTSNDIAVDGVGNIYIGGKFKNHLSFSYIDNFGQVSSKSVDRANSGCNHAGGIVAYVASFMPNGEPNFIQTANSCSTYVNTLEIRDDSKLFIGGGFWQGAQIGSVTLSIQSGALGAPHGNGYYFVQNGIDANGDATGSWSPSLEESFIATINTSNGEWDWVRKITGRNRDRINDIAVDSNGDAIIGGSFITNISFEDENGGLPDCCAGSLSSTGDYDIFIAKIDSDGNWIYADSNYDYVENRPGGSTDFLRSITIDENDNIYAIGSFVNHIDFGDDTLSTFGNRGELFVAKFDTSDNDFGWVWGCQASKPQGYTGSGISGWNTYRFGGISVDESGIPIVTGYFSTGITFDEEYTSAIFDSDGIIAPGAYVAKLSEDCAIPNLNNNSPIPDSPCEEAYITNQFVDTVATALSVEAELVQQGFTVLPFVIGVFVGLLFRRRDKSKSSRIGYAL